MAGFSLDINLRGSGHVHQHLARVGDISKVGFREINNRSRVGLLCVVFDVGPELSQGASVNLVEVNHTASAPLEFNQDLRGAAFVEADSEVDGTSNYAFKAVFGCVDFVVDLGRGKNCFERIQELLGLGV